jgi:hypothetical protein
MKCGWEEQIETGREQMCKKRSKKGLADPVSNTSF